jgi:uncharacterized protein
MDGRGMASDPERGFDMLVQGCDGGVALACSVALRWLNEPRADDAQKISVLRARLETELACWAGQDDACLSAGLSFYSGRDGFPGDRARAVRSYEVGCTVGAALACNNLGDALAYGDGTPKDVSRAIRLFDRACRMGEPIGCANLGYMVEHGEGATKDIPRARQLYGNACMSGDVYGCLHAEMLQAQRSSDEDASLAQWRERCDRDRDPRRAATACAFVGILYEDGPNGAARDEAKSLDAMSKACRLGEAYGCEWLKFHVEE